MELLDIFYQHQINQITNLSDLKTKILRYYPIFKPNIPSNQTQIIQICTFIQKIKEYQLLCEIKLDFGLNSLRFKYNLMKQTFLKSKNHYQKMMLQKYFLDGNLKNNGLILKIDPISSNIFIQKNLSTPNLGNYSYVIIDFIIENLLNQRNIIKDQFQKLIVLLNSQSNYIAQAQQTKQNILKNLKNYLQSSSYYSWNILTPVTEKSKQNKLSVTYSQTKKLFRQMKKKFKCNKLISIFHSLYKNNPKEQIPFFVLPNHEDNLLKEKYLQRNISICKQSLQIQEIDVRNEQLKKIKLNSENKLQTKNGIIKVFASKILNKKDQDYQFQILKQAQNYQFKGITKYYVPINTQKQQKNILLTNLVSTKSYQDYLSVNKQSMTMNTKIYLIRQIISTLKYLRDHEIVYNNLRPQNIKIKKGIVKLINFDNSYHSQVYKNKKNCFQNHFPYVSLIQSGRNRTVDDQRSDVFSLGGFIYYTLLGKNHMNIKQSLSRTFDNEISKQILTKPPLINLQKIDYMGKQHIMPLISLALKCLSHNQKIGTLNSIENIKNQSLNLEQRPYLDWSNIIMKYFEQHCKTYF